MKHIEDTVIRGHEVIILQDTTTELFDVDVRADNDDGAIIAGYSGFATVEDAKRSVSIYLDGFYDARAFKIADGRIVRA